MGLIWLHFFVGYVILLGNARLKFLCAHKWEVKVDVPNSDSFHFAPTTRKI